MNGKEISIKKAIEEIEVPEDRLNAILDNAFLETAPPKVKKRRKFALGVYLEHPYMRCSFLKYSKKYSYLDLYIMLKYNYYYVGCMIGKVE